MAKLYTVETHMYFILNENRKCSHRAPNNTWPFCMATQLEWETDSTRQVKSGPQRGPYLDSQTLVWYSKDTLTGILYLSYLIVVVWICQFGYKFLSACYLQSIPHPSPHWESDIYDIILPHMEVRGPGNRWGLSLYIYWIRRRCGLVWPVSCFLNGAGPPS